MRAEVRVRSSSGTSTSIPSYPASPARPHSTLKSLIDQDPLGLDQIYIQAKRYAEKNTVGREAIQAFVGALHGKGATKGIFITTSTFTAGAKDYAAVVPSRPVLIDGERLVALMLKYRVGVQVRQTFDVLTVDEDFFE